MLKRVLVAFWLVSTGWSAPTSSNATTYALGGMNQSPLYALRDTVTIRIEDLLFGNRKVAYWVNEQGQAIIDGDIIFGSEKDLLDKEIPPSSASFAAKRSFSVLSGTATWPNAEIIYKFDSAATETTLSDTVNNAINRWTAVAPFLHFTKQAASATPVNGVLTISANDCGGCVTSIGYSATSPRGMNLQQSSGKCPGGCYVNEAAHEFGHALGKPNPATLWQSAYAERLKNR